MSWNEFMIKGCVKMASIRDVAKAAGVSVATVSRAFNGYEDISEKTKKHVFEVAANLQYSPNLIARSLSSKKLTAIGIILSGLQSSDGKDNLVHDVLRGVYQFARENQLEVALYAIDKEFQEQTSFAQFCRERNISGAIIQGIRMDEPYFLQLTESTIPCVVIDVPVNSQYAGSISSDNILAASEITTYLLNQNHRNIGILSGLQSAAVTINRMAGIYSAFLEHNLPLHKSHIRYADFSEIGAYQQTIDLMQFDPSITALIAMSDLMAISAIRAIKDLGLKVPEDVSVVGFDGIPLSEYISPALTTIKQDFYTIAQTGAQLLLDMINNTDVPHHVTTPHSLVIRDSVKKL